MQRLCCAFVLSSVALTASAGDWPKYCANLAMTGVAASPGNVSVASARNLQVRWSVALRGPIVSSPTVVAGRVYIGDWSGSESALDVTNGEILASVNLGITVATACQPNPAGISSAAAVDDGTLFVAGGDQNFYALDADTLTMKWGQRLGDAPGYYGWCSPAVFDGSVVQGVSSNCDTPLVKGRVVALDRETGAVLTDTSMMTGEWPQDVVGAGVWTSPAVDIKNQTVFVTTGSSDSIADDHAFSIVRMSLPGMNITDSWKIATADWYDSDWGTSPTLFTGAHGRELVGAGQKDGAYYAFARDDLSSGPVWKTTIAAGGACPQCGEGVLSTAAYDGNMLYVGGGKIPNGNTGGGSVAALDPTDGHIVWQTACDGPVIAPIAYANGVVFTTSAKSMVAIDAATGEVLSRVPTRGACVGGVAITDAGIFFGDMSGTLYCVTATTPPARRRSVTAR